MLFIYDEKPTQIDNSPAIEPQRFYRCAANRGNAFQVEGIFTPSKMFVPTPLARVKKWDESTGHAVKTLDFDPFGAVATLTRQGKIAS